MIDTQMSSRTNIRRFLPGLIAALAAAAVATMLWATLAPVSFWAMLTPEHTGVNLSVSQAHQAAVARDITLIDIRRPEEWRKTGVGVGAQPLDMRRDDFIAVLSELVGGDLGAPVALICARGVRSARMSKRLGDAGFTNIIDVPEGMLGSRAGPGWLASALPTRAYGDASR